MEAESLVELWERARSRGEDVYLATVVHVRGSSYRKPGARMLVTSGGERAGTISGGCLEAEVSRKIAWLTQGGPALKRYRSSFDEEGEASYGLGCDGEVWVLLEAGDAVDATMTALQTALVERRSAVLLLSFAEGNPTGARVVSGDVVASGLHGTVPENTSDLASRALRENRAIESEVNSDASFPELICLPIKPPTKLHVFGAGEDAEPIVRFAAELGWEVWVSDGRAQLLRRERFPRAKRLVLLSYSTEGEGQRRQLRSDLRVEEEDCAVVLTHSYEQDRVLLKHLLQVPMRYLGILGPLRRTKRIVAEIAGEIGLTPEECLARLHAPVGLKMGTHEPLVIALAITVEIQASISGKSLRVEPGVGHPTEASFSLEYAPSFVREMNGVQSAGD